MNDIQRPGTTAEARHAELFQRLIEEGFNQGRLEIVDEVCSADYVEHQDGHSPPDREGVKEAIRFLHALAPDFQITIEDLAFCGDRVWARLTGRGTHLGDVLGTPSGRRFEITVMDLCRFSGGRLVEHWGVADRLAQFQQLGLKHRSDGRDRPN